MKGVLVVLLALCAPSLAAQAPPQFERDVLPILEQRCFRCHSAPRVDDSGRVQKPKGDLRLDGKEWILRGGDGGEVVVPGRPEDSELWILTALPPDDPDVMPAKGDPLTQAEQDVLRRWIAAGASFGEWVGVARSTASDAAEPVVDVPEPGRVRLWRELAEGLRPLPASQLASVAGDDAKITPLWPDGPLLAVRFTAHEAAGDDARIAKLAPLREHVAELDLGRTAITDAALREVGRMKRLTRLDLDGTAISDVGLAALRGLDHLRSLNLFGTRVGDGGLTMLVELPNLERVYLWQSHVTPEGLARLRERRPGLLVIGAPQLPDAEPAGGAERPARRRR
jgi:hypothetical protein